MASAIWLLALVPLTALFVPSASADTCDEREILYAGGDEPVRVTLFTCSQGYMWYYDPQAIREDPRCALVPPVRVLGQDVPGTGAEHCTPLVYEDPSGVEQREESPMAYVRVEIGDDVHETPLHYWITTCWVGSVLGERGLPAGCQYTGTPP